MLVKARVEPMTGPACLVFDDELTAYDFGPAHPMAPVRVDLTMRLARELGVLDLPDVDGRPAPRSPTDDELAPGPRPTDYIDAVKAASDDPAASDLLHGLGTDDNPAFEGMHEASAHIVGATLEAARRVWDGRGAARRQHQRRAAPRDGRRGERLLHLQRPGDRDRLAAGRNGAERVAYVDIDVHHGDGVQAAFYDDPRVLTISLHESPQTLLPRHRATPSESGGPGAEGTSVNVALPPGTGDGGWLRAFHAVVPPLLREFEPDVLVTQHGCDSHMDDPLAHLMLRSTVSAPRTWRCTTWPTRCARVAGSSPAAAGTRSSTSSRGPGPTCSRSSAASRRPADARPRRTGAQLRRGAHRPARRRSR